MRCTSRFVCSSFSLLLQPVAPIDSEGKSRLNAAASNFTLTLNGPKGMEKHWVEPTDQTMATFGRSVSCDKYDACFVGNQFKIVVPFFVAFAPDIRQGGKQFVFGDAAQANSGTMAAANHDADTSLTPAKSSNTTAPGLAPSSAEHS